MTYTPHSFWCVVFHLKKKLIGCSCSYCLHCAGRAFFMMIGLRRRRSDKTKRWTVGSGSRFRRPQMCSFDPQRRQDSERKDDCDKSTESVFWVHQHANRCHGPATTGAENSDGGHGPRFGWDSVAERTRRPGLAPSKTKNDLQQRGKVTNRLLVQHCRS